MTAASIAFDLFLVPYVGEIQTRVFHSCLRRKPEVGCVRHQSASQSIASERRLPVAAGPMEGLL